MQCAAAGDLSASLPSKTRANGPRQSAAEAPEESVAFDSMVLALDPAPDANTTRLTSNAMRSNSAAEETANVRAAPLAGSGARPVFTAVVFSALVGPLATEEPIEGDGGRASGPSPLPEAREPDQQAVFVLGADDAAVVAVRTAGAFGDPNALGDAIARTAAAYGVRLDELHINGSTQSLALLPKGNSRGRHTR